ncbi:MAG: hypothetical protein ABSD64_05150 [Terriglobales bacterium]|jgi:hypothetical protein
MKSLVLEDDQACYHLFQMELKDQFREGYVPGKEAYKLDASKRPWWDRLIFFAVPIVSALATDGWLAHHSSLGSGWQFAIAVGVGSTLMVVCSLALDKLRKPSGR